MKIQIAKYLRFVGVITSLLLVALFFIFCGDNIVSPIIDDDKPTDPDVSEIVVVQQPIQVVCVGNSITEGYGNTSEAKAWPAQLNKLLGKQYAVSNCGVSGTTMFKNSNSPYWNTSRFTTAKSLNPHILIIGLGTNDADPGRWATLKSEFYSDYRAMIQEFRTNGKNPIVYICLPPPLFGIVKANQNAIVENELIPIIKEISGAEKTYVIDFHYPLTSESNAFPDAIHPNDVGSGLMARIAFNAISSNQLIIPSLSVNGGESLPTTSCAVQEGGTVVFKPQPEEGTWAWLGPNGFRATDRVITLKNIGRGGTYTAFYTDLNGKRSVQNFLISVKGCRANPIAPYSQVNGGVWTDAVSVKTHPGGAVVFGPQTDEGSGTWLWVGPNEYFSSSRTLSLNTIIPSQAGEYIVTYTNTTGCQSNLAFTVVVEGEVECPTLKPYMNVNGIWKGETEAEIQRGGGVTFGPQPSDGEWNWTGPNNFTATGREVSISNFNEAKVGKYIGVFTNALGCKESLVFTLTVASSY